MAPGVKPANRTSATWPPSVAVTFATASATGLAGDTSPVTTAGFTIPCPLMYTVIQLPAAAGWSAPLRELSELIATARLEPYTMIPGALAATVKDTAAEPPTASVAVPGGVS